MFVTKGGKYVCNLFAGGQANGEVRKEKGEPKMSQKSLICTQNLLITPPPPPPPFFFYTCDFFLSLPSASC